PAKIPLSPMCIYRRRPVPPLDQHVAFLWYYVDYYPTHAREFVLPAGTLELVINLENRPRKLFDRADLSHYESFRQGWVSGAQHEHLVIDALPASTMIGAHFRPGGAAAFLGVPCHEITGEVVELEAIWGAAFRSWRERLLAARGAES